MKIVFKAGLLIGISALAILFYTLNPSEHQLFPKCIFYSLTGYYCPGCGSQRAIHGLLHLNFASVVSNNILFLPALAAILYHYLQQLLNWKLNWKLPNIFYHKVTPWVILGIVILFWILRNVPITPFSFLAPN